MQEMKEVSWILLLLWQKIQLPDRIVPERNRFSCLHLSKFSSLSLEILKTLSSGKVNK